MVKASVDASVIKSEASRARGIDGHEGIGTSRVGRPVEKCASIIKH